MHTGFSHHSFLSKEMERPWESRWRDREERGAHLAFRVPLWLAGLNENAVVAIPQQRNLRKLITAHAGDDVTNDQGELKKVSGQCAWIAVTFESWSQWALLVDQRRRQRECLSLGLSSWNGNVGCGERWALEDKRVNSQSAVGGRLHLEFS